MCGENGEHSGNLYPGNDGESSLTTTVTQALGGSQFHRLELRGMYSGRISRKHDSAAAYQSDQTADNYARHRELALAASHEVPGADSDYEYSTGNPAACNGVAELGNSHRIGNNLPEGAYRGHLAANGFRIEGGPDRILHPAVGDKYPIGRDCGTDACKPSGSEVEFLAHLVPTEEHHREESSLHEECEDTLDGKRGTEHVTYEPGIIAPVSTELKLEDEAGGDADGEVDGKQLHPELRRLFPEFVFFDEIKGLHHSHHQCQAEGQRHEQPMVGCRHGELDAGPKYQIHNQLFWLIVLCVSTFPIFSTFSSSVIPAMTGRKKNSLKMKNRMNTFRMTTHHKVLPHVMFRKPSR